MTDLAPPSPAVAKPAISSSEMPGQPGKYLGSVAMQQAVANMMLGDRLALATSAAAAGYPGELPARFLFVGQRTGGGFAAEVAANTVDHGASVHLLGVVMLDGVASPDRFPASLAKLDSVGIPLYQIASPPPVDINQYAGAWYEIGSVKQNRFDLRFNIKAVYTPQPDGSIEVENSGNTVGSGDPEWSVTGSAVAVNTLNTRLSVSFSGEPNRSEPGNYWILDDAPDYSWAIVGDAYGNSGTILTRQKFVTEAEYNALVARAHQLGVRGKITPTAQYP